MASPATASLRQRLLLGGGDPATDASKRALVARRRRCCLRRGATVRCVQTEEKTRRTTVKNGEDSLDICRVLNGMWQTSGGWGRIDRDDAVEAMLRFADAGLSTFDMADHCNPLVTPSRHSLYNCGRPFSKFEI